MQVDVYFNLHKKCWSIRDRATGRVVCHANRVELTQVTFAVGQAGNARVRSESRKNVHAWVTGTLVSWDSGTLLSDSVEMYHQARTRIYSSTTQVTYNPYKYSSFVFVDNTRLRIKKAKSVVMQSRRVYLGR